MEKSQIVKTLLAAVLCLGLGAMPCYADSTVRDVKADRYAVVIVGGGISGLTCGYFLRDMDILILEKEGAVGGRAVSGVKGGFTYAKGTEYLGEPEDELAQMIRELKLTLREIPSPMDAYFDGENFYYGHEGIKRYLITNSSGAAYRKFVSLVQSVYKIYDEVPEIDYTPQIMALDNMSAAEWLRENGIPEVFIKKYNVTARGLFGATMDEISALSLIPEAAYDYGDAEMDDDEKEDYKGFGKKDLQKEYNEAKKESSGSYSFTKGITELSDKIGEVLKRRIKLNSEVTSITRQGNEYLITYNSKGKSYSVLAGKVVLAVPSPVALKIASKVLTKEKIEILNTIKFSSYATVALFSKEPIFDKAFDLAVPNEYFFTDVYDATWVERFYSPNMKNSKEYITSVYVGPRIGADRSLHTMNDQELLKNIYTDLNKIFPGVERKVTGYSIERFPYAYPIMSKGAYGRLLRLNELNEGSVILAGDYMVYPTFEGAVQSGHRAAELIMDDDDDDEDDEE